MTTEQINQKIVLTEAAVKLNQEGTFTIPRLAKDTGLTASDIYRLFPNKKAILRFYYPSLVIRYRAMIEEIEDFETYTISEKLSNFMFTLFDLMMEQREFVDDTFDTMVFKSGKKTPFHKEVQALFTEFFTTDPNIAVSAGFLMKDYFYGFIRDEYLHVIKFWLNDGSHGYEKSMALTDKLTGFVEELIYNKTIDKGFDLFKYLLGSAGLGRKIPIVGNWITEFFEGEDKA
ncbi:MAG: hypothetical protein AAFW89_15095 [Bacteroidota bacterium]